MASTAGELRDIATAFEEVDKALDKQDAAIAELQRKLAVVDREQKHMENLLTLFQDEMREGFRRIREGLR